MDKIKGFSIIHSNVRSLLRKTVEIEHNFTDFDIIGLTETWLSGIVDSNVIGVSGYSLIRKDRSTKWDDQVKKSGGGTAFYIEDNLNQFVSCLESYSKVTKTLKQLWIKIEKPNFKKQLIGLMYRPPNGSSKDGLDELRETLTCLRDDMPFTYELTILGDFNIDYKKNQRY